MSQDVMMCVMNSTAVFDDVNVEMQSSEPCVKCVDLDAELLNKQSVYNDLLISYSQLEKHCISLELTMQLNQEIFQKDSLSNNQNALEIPEYFENNDLKAQLQAKDTTIWKEVENAAQIPIATTVAPGMFKLDLDPLAPREKKVAITPMNKVKKLRFSEPLTSSSNIKQVESSTTSDSNTHVLSSTGLKCSTSTCRSQSIGNKKNDRISQKPSSNRKNKVEAQHRKQCMFDANHDVCFLDFVNDVNMHAKSKSKSKKSQVQNIWKPMGKVFIDVGLKWKPTGRPFIIVGNSCPLIRFTPNKILPLKETTYNSVETPKPKIKVYSRRPKQIKSVGSSKKAKIVESKIANNSEPNHLWGSNATDVPSSSSLVNNSKFLGTIRFENDQVAKIIGYGDYQLGNVIISRVYYVEGLGHNLFSVGKFCDTDLEVAFWKNTCHIWNLEGVDLLSGSSDTNLYTISLDDMLKTSSICLLSKASNTKSWLWHRRLSHLNFGTLNKLSKDGLARGIPKLKFQKDHMCSASALGKSNKSSHQPKAKDTNQ
ncbi:integrase, catalytic region, zinc finger, CCHC-type containing protein [Tanacetum coccineum]